jgi:hypothetical protein
MSPETRLNELNKKASLRLEQICKREMYAFSYGAASHLYLLVAELQRTKNKLPSTEHRLYWAEKLLLGQNRECKPKT